MKAKLRMTLTSLLLLGASLFVNAQTLEKKTLTIEGARKVIAGAVAYARKNNAPGGVIAVVDDGGNLMALERLDGTFAAGANISIGKARTAVLFKRPTKAFEDIIKNGRTAMVALPDAYFTPLQGGVPITIDGQIVGGVGVSGAASAQQDEELAMAGANVFTAMKESGMTPANDSSVLFFDAKQVNASFSTGAALLDEKDRHYMVHTSRRDKPGLAEIHALDTDIIYVLEGTATFVTGGTERQWTPKRSRLTNFAARESKAASHASWQKAKSSSCRTTRHTGSRKLTASFCTTRSRFAEVEVTQ